MTSTAELRPPPGHDRTGGHHWIGGDSTENTLAYWHPGLPGYWTTWGGGMIFPVSGAHAGWKYLGVVADIGAGSRIAGLEAEIAQLKAAAAPKPVPAKPAFPANALRHRPTREAIPRLGPLVPEPDEVVLERARRALNDNG